MDPFTGFVLALIMFTVVTTVNIVTWPFRKAKEVAAAHPRRTARMVLGAIAAAFLTYVFHLPYGLEVSFAGGVVGLIIGEIFS